MTEELDWENYISGPFCSHWDSQWDCDEPCICGHRCRDHILDECDRCECNEFKDANDSGDTLKKRAGFAFGEQK